MKFLQRIKSVLVVSLVIASLTCVYQASAVSASYAQDDGNVYYTNAGSAISVGDIVAVGTLTCGVVLSDIAASTGTGWVATRGIFRCAKRSAYTWSAGAKLYWDGTYTTTTLATSYKFLGFASGAATSGSTTANVELAPFRAEGARVLTITDDTTLSAVDTYSGRLLVIGNCTTKTLTLPAIASCPTGCTITLKKTGSAGAITIDGNASETIDGATTKTDADAQYDTYTIQSTGTAWLTVARWVQ